MAVQRNVQQQPAAAPAVNTTTSTNAAPDEFAAKMAEARAAHERSKDLAQRPDTGGLQEELDAGEYVGRLSKLVSEQSKAAGTPQVHLEIVVNGGKDHGRTTRHYFNLTNENRTAWVRRFIAATGFDNSFEFIDWAATGAQRQYVFTQDLVDVLTTIQTEAPTLRFKINVGNTGFRFIDILEVIPSGTAAVPPPPPIATAPVTQQPVAPVSPTVAATSTAPTLRDRLLVLAVEQGIENISETMPIDELKAAFEGYEFWGRDASKATINKLRKKYSDPNITAESGLSDADIATLTEAGLEELIVG